MDKLLFYTERKTLMSEYLKFILGFLNSALPDLLRGKPLSDSLTSGLASALNKLEHRHFTVDLPHNSRVQIVLNFMPKLRKLVCFGFRVKLMLVGYENYAFLRKYNFIMRLACSLPCCAET